MFALPLSHNRLTSVLSLYSREGEIGKTKIVKSSSVLFFLQILHRRTEEEKRTERKQNQCRKTLILIPFCLLRPKRAKSGGKERVGYPGIKAFDGIAFALSALPSRHALSSSVAAARASSLMGYGN